MNTNTSFKSNLSKSLYLIRGIAISLVVIGHVIGYNRNYGMRQIYDSDFYLLGWICDLINTFHMPTFFIVSGVGFAIFSKKDISYKQFFSSKFQKLLIPLIIWSPLYFIFQSLSKGRQIELINIIQVIFYPYEIFWFLHALIFCALFAFIYFKFFKSTLGYLLISIILFTANSFLIHLGWSLPGSYFWNLFYAFGVFVTKYLFELDLLPLKNNYEFKKVIIVVFSIMIMVVTLHFLPKDADVDYLRIVNGIIGFLCLYIVCDKLITNLSNTKLIYGKLLATLTNFFIYSGKVSMVIYLFHGYFTGLLKTIMFKVGILPNPSLYFVIVSYAGILGPILIYEILKNRSRLFLYSIGSGK
jgi:fucose 4-O-acetylase-like acetyltransferase